MLKTAATVDAFFSITAHARLNDWARDCSKLFSLVTEL